MSLNNETGPLNNTLSARTIADTLNLVQQQFINQLPLIISILGLVGFIGNAFTFLQPTLRKNSFCIYTLFGSVVDITNLAANLLPNYLDPSGFSTGPISFVRLVCKSKLFALVFLPQSSMNLLIMSLIDRYACTYGPTSRMRQILQLRMVPWLIGITIVFSGVISLYPVIIYDIVPGQGCTAINTHVYSVLYISIQGLMTPIVMLIIVLLTYRRVKQSRQRVGAVVVGNRNRIRNQFIATAFAQVFVTSFFVLQWIIMYVYFLASQYENKSADGWAITYFVLSLTNNLYYIINVRSFYLSTLTSRLFRDTLIMAILKLLPGRLYQRWTVRNQDATMTLAGGTQREGRIPI